MRYDWDDRTLIAVHNLSSRRVTADLDVSDVAWTAAHDLLGGDRAEPAGGGRLVAELDGYGFQWLRLEKPGQRTTP